MTQIDPWPASALVPLGQGHPGGQARPEARLDPRKLNTSHAKCKSSFIFAILLCVFEGRCHQVLYFTRKSAARQRHGLGKGFKAPLSTPLEPLSASTVWGIYQQKLSLSYVMLYMSFHGFIPQTVLALRGSNGVGLVPRIS